MKLVGVIGFEPMTPRSQGGCSDLTELRTVKHPAMIGGGKFTKGFHLFVTHKLCFHSCKVRTTGVSLAFCCCHCNLD